MTIDISALSKRLWKWDIGKKGSTVTLTYMTAKIVVAVLHDRSHEVSSWIYGKQYGPVTRLDPEFSSVFAESLALGRAEALEITAEWIDDLYHVIFPARNKFDIKCGGDDHLNVMVCSITKSFCISIQDYPNGLEAGKHFNFLEFER